MADDSIRTGRVGRGLPLAGLTARTTVGRVAGKLRRGDEQRELEQFTREAERYVRVLGDMKGVAMKLGQLLSFLDTSAIPEAYRDAYQQIAGALQADAPPMPFETVRQVIERELGRPVDEVFTWIGERAMAAASIGQVHAAHLLDGREVVVKVQYPGVADAIASDLANAELLTSIISLGARLGPIRVATDPRELAAEIRERISEELDYRIEAANLTEFGERYKGHPFIRIPRVHTELSTERVLVMDEADGLRWAAALEQPQDLKDRWGEVINRFVYGSLYQYGIFNADPHPGNYLFHDDGSVTFLDFGCVVRFNERTLRSIREVALASSSPQPDAERLAAALVGAGLVTVTDRVNPQRILEWYRPMWAPVLTDEPTAFTPEWAAFVIERNFDLLGEHGEIVRSFRVSRELTFLSRIQLGLFSVLGALRATAPWRAVQSEIIRAEPPQTDLGRQHAAWVVAR